VRFGCPELGADDERHAGKAERDADPLPARERFAEQPCGQHRGERRLQRTDQRCDADRQTVDNRPIEGHHRKALQKRAAPQ
jgi:hypothetical protein